MEIPLYYLYCHCKVYICASESNTTTISMKFTTDIHYPWRILDIYIDSNKLGGPMTFSVLHPVKVFTYSMKYLNIYGTNIGTGIHGFQMYPLIFFPPA